MPVIHDDEFGEITVRRSMRASSVRLSVGPDGKFRASMPTYAPIFVLKRLIRTSRPQLRKMISHNMPAYKLENGLQIGKSHKLIITSGQSTSVKRSGQQILVTLADGDMLAHPEIEREVRHVITKALRIEAKNYLPRRLSYLAEKIGCEYKKARFSHAGSRWGSCSSTGTISLNIALMKLPHELIDYVIIHELCHTKQMNHSPKFWALVENADPEYKSHRKELKTHSPMI